MSEQMRTTVEIDDSRQITADSILFTLFGMSVDELVKEIRNDETGEYAGIIAGKGTSQKVG